MKRIFNKEIINYTEEMHLSKISNKLQLVYNELKERILDLDPSITQINNKGYICFKLNSKRICSFRFKKKFIEVALNNLNKGQLIDVKNMTFDISNREWPATVYAFKLYPETDLVLAINLILQSYEKVK